MYALRKTSQVIRVEESRFIQGNQYLLRFCHAPLTLSAALSCSLGTLMKVGDFVATERAICMVCEKPANQSCVRCKVRYCSRVRVKV